AAAGGAGRPVPRARSPRGSRPRARRHRRRRARRPRRARPRVHHAHHRGPAPPRGRRPHPARRLALGARRGGRHRRPHPREGPREHGDRPQRPARPVGLDAGPRDPLEHLGVGRRLHRGVVEVRAQLPAPHVHERRGARPRPRLLGDARGARAAVASGLPRPARLLLPHGGGLRVGDRALRHGARRGPPRREVQGALAPRDRRAAAQGPPPDPQGLRAVPGARRPPRRPPRAGGPRDRERRAQRVGPHDRLLRAHPRSGRDVLRGAVRGGDARRLVPAPAPRLVQPRGQPALPPADGQPLLPDRAPPVPRPAEQPVRGDGAEGARAVRAPRAAVQLGPARAAVPVRLQAGPAARVPGRL
ncbi:MAG: Linoleoyl-CoA desaturase, partial [uncultured Solirubrobacteraceae bacterium]